MNSRPAWWIDLIMTLAIGAAVLLIIVAAVVAMIEPV